MFDRVLDMILQLSAAVGATRIWSLLTTVLYGTGLLSHEAISNGPSPGSVQNDDEPKLTKKTSTATTKTTGVLQKRQLFPLGTLRVDSLASSSVLCPVACATDANFNLVPVRNNAGGVIGWDFNQEQAGFLEDDGPVSQPAFFEIPSFSKGNPEVLLSHVHGGASSATAAGLHQHPQQQQQQQQQQQRQQHTDLTSLFDGMSGSLDMSIDMDSVPLYPGTRPVSGPNKQLVMRRGNSMSSAASVSPAAFPYAVPQNKTGFVRSDSQSSSSMETPELQQSSPPGYMYQMQQQQQQQHQQQPQQHLPVAATQQNAQDIYSIFDPISMFPGEQKQPQQQLQQQQQHMYNDSQLHGQGAAWFGAGNDLLGGSDGSSDEFEVPMHTVGHHNNNTHQQDDFWKVHYESGSYESLGGSTTSAQGFSMSPQSNFSGSSYSKSPESLDASHLPKSVNRGRKAKATPIAKGGEGKFVCPECDAAFKIKGYLTRHIKKHATQKAYTCPFFDPTSEHPCHPNGGFSRRDTYKTHLKARHFLYPPGTRSQSRGKVSGKCQGCGVHYDCNEDWVEKHIQSEMCSGVVRHRHGLGQQPEVDEENDLTGIPMMPANLFHQPHPLNSNLTAVLTI